MEQRVEVAISCEGCVRRGTPDCADCLVTHVVGGPPDELVMTAEESDVVELLTKGGLLPRLRYAPRA